MVIDILKFNSRELAVINVMRRTQRPLTTNQIAEKSGMVWQTADKALKKLFDRGYVKRGRTVGGVTYWALV